MKAAAGIVSGTSDPAPIVAANRFADPVRWRVPPSPLQQVFFTHVTPLISTGHIRRLEPEDLCHLPELDSEDLAAKFDRDWAEERRRRPDKPSLVRACLVGSGPTLIYTGILYIIAQATLFSGPVLLRLIVEALECRAAGGASCPSNQDLYYYAMYLTLAGVVQNLCQAQQDYTMQRLGVRVRNRLMCALYRKVLRLSPLGLQEETTGKIVTLMSNTSTNCKTCSSSCTISGARRFSSSPHSPCSMTSSSGPHSLASCASSSPRRLRSWWPRRCSPSASSCSKPRRVASTSSARSSTACGSSSTTPGRSPSRNALRRSGTKRSSSSGHLRRSAPSSAWRSSQHQCSSRCARSGPTRSRATRSRHPPRTPPSRCSTCSASLSSSSRSCSPTCSTR